MVAIVNGYVCFTCCDADKAKQGKDPNAKPGELPDGDFRKTQGHDSRPVTILDGALKEFAKGLDPAKSSDTSNPASSKLPPGDTNPSSSVNLLA